MPKRRGSTKRRIGAVVEVEGQVLVRPGGRPVEQQPARHAEMEQQRLAVVEHQLDEFRPPGEALQPASRQPRGRCSRQGEAEVGAALRSTSRRAG